MGHLDLTEPTDWELVVRFRTGNDPDTLNELVHRYTGRIRAVVFPLLLNDTDADDVTQEALLRVLDSLGTFRGDAAFSTWAYRIAVNTAKNYLKRRNRRWSLLSERSDPETVADAAYLAPARAAETADSDRAISAAMAQLPFAQRTALTLVAIQGLDGREAARAAGCNAATLRWHLHQARKRMRQILEEEGVT